LLSQNMQQNKDAEMKVPTRNCIWVVATFARRAVSKGALADGYTNGEAKNVATAQASQMAGSKQPQQGMDYP